MVNKENKLLTDSLREKTSELKEALSRLSDYAAELERTADLRARNNLMHELHDELGHILTTASIGLQAAAILLDQDVPAAKIRMELVTKQIQEAMKYLRQVISGESSDQNEINMSLIQSLRKLIRETEKHTGIPIKNNLEDLFDEKFEALSPPKRTFLYNALMEGLTNGIRHACPNKFEFFLDMTDSQIRFSIWDDGATPHDITYGYGLSKMASDAAGYGGTLDISNQDGFTMKITLPVSIGTEVS